MVRCGVWILNPFILLRILLLQQEEDELLPICLLDPMDRPHQYHLLPTATDLSNIVRERHDLVHRQQQMSSPHKSLTILERGRLDQLGNHRIGIGRFPLNQQLDSNDLILFTLFCCMYLIWLSLYCQLSSNQVSYLPLTSRKTINLWVPYYHPYFFGSRISTSNIESVATMSFIVSIQKESTR